MKKIFAIISFIVAAVLLGVAYKLMPNQTFIESVLISLGTSFVTLGVGIIFVNIYMERSSRKGAVQSLFVLSGKAIHDFHNTLLSAAWAKFGKEDWDKYTDSFYESAGDPEVLRDDVRDFLYCSVRDNLKLQKSIGDLEMAFIEMSRLVGWDLDAALLEDCLDLRISIGRLHEVKFDDTNESKTEISKHILDADFHSGHAREILMRIGGIPDDDEE